MNTLLAPPHETQATLDAPLEYLSSNGVRIPLRVYGRENQSTPIVLSHGLQSHSGWFTNSCSFLASQGFPVYAYDRRGSGVSEEARGDCRDFQDWIADLEVVARHAMSIHQAKRVHLFGHSLGAVSSAAFACTQPTLVRSLVLATPGFYSQNDIGLKDKLRVFASQISKREVRLPALLQPEVFSETRQYIEFIRDDELALPSLTGSLLWQVVRMRKWVNARKAKLTMPVVMMCAGHDPVCDTPKNHQLWSSLPSLCKEYIEYEHTRHVLEFGPERETFFNDLARWLQRLENQNRIFP